MDNYYLDGGSITDIVYYIVNRPPRTPDAACMSRLSRNPCASSRHRLSRSIWAHVSYLHFPALSIVAFSH